jgi:hypothetical protein
VKYPTHAVACSICNAPIGDGCIDGDGVPCRGSHAARHTAHHRLTHPLTTTPREHLTAQQIAFRPERVFVQPSIDDDRLHPQSTRSILRLWKTATLQQCLWLEWLEWTTKQRRWWCSCGQHGPWKIATEAEIARDAETHSHTEVVP